MKSRRISIHVVKHHLLPDVEVHPHTFKEIIEELNSGIGESAGDMFMHGNVVYLKNSNVPIGFVRVFNEERVFRNDKGEEASRWVKTCEDKRIKTL